MILLLEQFQIISCLIFFSFLSCEILLKRPLKKNMIFIILFRTNCLYTVYLSRANILSVLLSLLYLETFILKLLCKCLTSTIFKNQNLFYYLVTSAIKYFNVPAKSSHSPLLHNRREGPPPLHQSISFISSREYLPIPSGFAKFNSVMITFYLSLSVFLHITFFLVFNTPLQLCLPNVISKMYDMVCIFLEKEKK